MESDKIIISGPKTKPCIIDIECLKKGEDEFIKEYLTKEKDDDVVLEDDDWKRINLLIKDKLDQLFGGESIKTLEIKYRWLTKKINYLNIMPEFIFSETKSGFKFGLRYECTKECTILHIRQRIKFY
jgi:hypothetical protein